VDSVRITMFKHHFQTHVILTHFRERVFNAKQPKLEVSKMKTVSHH
jgi:hypothetical protein